ncbi:cellulose-binding [Fusarium albosuccineum]|uniref:Cellulose-binding n=1 Tax=Fusarium albosuccineum TaxID=1237068 RepID=A0A8H4NZD7_9HYPO|nr:cellulose-binding [Fusarium albosuccineum]
MVHLLASADLFEIEGLIATTGWSIDYPDPLHPGLISDVIDKYRSDLPNLMKRSEQQAFEDDEVQQQIGYWPSPEYLESVIRVGLPGRGMRWVGDNNATSGSDWIIRTVDEEDDRPVWVTIWGGGNTLAQAIWDVKRTRSQEELDLFLSKIRVYAITDQDNDGWDDMQSSAQLWIRKTFPELFYISSEWGWIIYGTTIQGEYWNSTYTSEIQGKGALGKHYPTYRYTVEGDTPSWLYLWPGMNDPEDPSQSSFGGCFARTITRDNVTKPYTDYETEARDCTNATIQRIMPDQVNDFISRLDWAAEGTGNRNPRVVLEGDHG